MLFENVARRPACAVVVLCLAGLGTGCAGRGEEEEEEPVAELEEPLALAVDELSVRHGSLRIAASMEDGSADVAMWLGGTCEPAEVGRGIATRSAFRWSLSSDEVARAIECGLVVKAHGVNDEGLRVVKTAALEVGVSLEADGAENVALTAQVSVDASTTLTFGAPRRVSHIFVGGSVIGADDVDDDEPSNDVYPSSFTIENRDLSRAMMQRRQVSVLGEYFLATVTIGGVTLDVTTPESDQEAEPAQVLVPTVRMGHRYVPDEVDVNSEEDEG